MSTEHPRQYPRRAFPATRNTAGTAKSENSYAVVRIRAALVARGSSLRAWGMAWGRRRGLTSKIELQSAYNTVKRTVERWAGRRDAPRGVLAAGIMAELRADLGPLVVPPLINIPPAQPGINAGEQA